MLEKQGNDVVLQLRSRDLVIYSAISNDATGFSRQSLTPSLLLRQVARSFTQDTSN